MAGVALSAFTDGFFRGRAFRDAKEEREYNRKRQERLDEIMEERLGMERGRYDRAGELHDMQIAEAERLRAEEEERRNFYRTTLGATEAPSGDNQIVAPQVPLSFGAIETAPTSAKTGPEYDSAGNIVLKDIQPVKGTYPTSDLGALPQDVEAGASMTGIQPYVPGEPREIVPSVAAKHRGQNRRIAASVERNGGVQVNPDPAMSPPVTALTPNPMARQAVDYPYNPSSPDYRSGAMRPGGVAPVAADAGQNAPNVSTGSRARPSTRNTALGAIEANTPETTPNSAVSPQAQAAPASTAAAEAAAKVTQSDMGVGKKPLSFPKQVDRGAQTYVDKIAEVMPKLIDFEMQKGNIDKAQTLMEIYESNAGKKATRALGRAIASYTLGDIDSTVGSFIEAQKAYGYLDSSITVDEAKTGAFNKPDGTQGIRAVYRDQRTGQEITQEFDSMDEMFQMAYGSLNPEALAERLMESREGSMTENDIVTAAINLMGERDIGSSMTFEDAIQKVVSGRASIGLGSLGSSQGAPSTYRFNQ